MENTRTSRFINIVAVAIVLGGVALWGTGCSQEAAKKSSGDVSTASFKADPSKMTAEEKVNYERLTGGKSAPATKTP